MTQPPRAAPLADLLTAKIPPNDILTERAVLGLLLTDARSIGPARDILKAETFYKEHHRIVFTAVRDLAERGDTADVLTVSALLKNRSELEEIGGPATLAALADEAVILPSLSTYALRIRECAARRDAIRAGTEVINRAYEPGSTLAEIQQAADRLAESVTSSAAPDDRPTVELKGGVYTVRWPTTPYRLVVDSLHLTTEGAYAECRLVNGTKPGGVSSRVNLLTDRGRGDLAKRMKRGSGLDWESMIDEAAELVLEAARTANPAVELSGEPASTTALDCVEDFLPLGDVSIIFGDGDNLKSMIAALVALAVASGRPVAGGLLRPTDRGGVPVMIVDYEANEATARRRVHRLETGLRIPARAPIYYKRADAPIWTIARELRREVAELGVGFLVLDSLGAASGEAPESPGAALMALGALRSLEGVTCFAIAHVSKAVADHAGSTRPFGSVFTRNGSRIAWEAKGSESDSLPDGGQVRTVSLTCQKVNDGPRPKPIAVRFHFGAEKGRGPILVEPASIADSASLMQKAKLQDRVEAAIERGEVLDLEALLEATGHKNAKSLLTTLGRMVTAKKLVRLEHPGEPLRWARRSSRLL